MIINNYLEGLQGTRWDAPIALTQGDAIDGSSSNWSKHFRAERVTIAYNTLVNNTHGIEIGYDNNDKYNKGLKDITIANNIVTGSENSLVTYHDGNTQAGEITWSNNVFSPTGNATLSSDNSTFNANEVNVIDPLLIYDGTVWKSTATSPTGNNDIPNVAVNEDIEGQARPNLSTVGADHFSSDPVLYGPITTDDVGPNSQTTTAINPSFNQFSINIYPVPTADYLQLDNLSHEMESLQIFSISGEKVWEQSLKNITDSSTKLNINSLSNGFYILRVLGKTGQLSQKILIRK